MPDDFDATILTLGTASSGVPAFGSIEDPGDEDWFRVDFIEGHRYEIQLRGAPTFDGSLPDPVFLGVFDSDGRFRGAGNDDANANTLNSLSTYTATYTGPHFLSAASFLGESGNTGTYTLEFMDLGLAAPGLLASELINEGDEVTFSIPNDIPSGISLPFPNSGSPDELIAARQLTITTIIGNTITDDDFDVFYTFGDPQSLTFRALDDDLVEDDETVIVRVTGYIDWIVPTFSSGLLIDNLLGGEVQGFIEQRMVDYSFSITINSAPEGDVTPITDYTFSGPEIIGNVLTNFEDGSEEYFSALPFSFSSETLVGEVLANGDLSITDSTAQPGQTVVVRFTVEDERGALTLGEQLITFGAMRDDYLPGETALVYGSIDVGTPEQGSIEIAGDLDRFQVLLEAGQLYSIDLTSMANPSGTLADPEIFGVYDSLNVLLPASSDNDSGLGLNAQVELFVETTGTYDIAVGSHTSFGTGGYQLSVTSLGAADDYLPGTYATSFGSALIDVPTRGVIERAGDRDRFDVTLQAGVQYDISLEGAPTGGGSLGNPQIIGVYGSNGALIAGSSDNDGGVGLNALVSGLTVAADGVYQIEVASANVQAIGDYTLTVQNAGYVDDFLPGISAGFGAVAIGGRATGEIETIGDVDGFRVSLQSNTTYQISILGQDSNNGTLLDPDLLGIFSTSDLSGTPISSVQTLNTQFVGDDSISYFTPQSAGEYFIGVQDSFGGLGTYTVAVDNIGIRDDYAADVDTTGAIAPGGNATGRIDFAQDNDWFEVNLSAGRLYEIGLEPIAGGDALADPYFNGVYDSNGVLIQNTSNDDGGTGSSSSLQFVTDVGGTHYLSAGGFGTSTGQYRLVLNDLGPLDDGSFDITIEFASDNVSSAYVRAFEDAVDRWEEIITGDLPYAFVEGYGFVDDILIEVAVEDIELTFEGVEQTILAISSVLDQRPGISGASALPTYSRIVINSEEVGSLLNLDELVANTIGRALGFGSLWEEFGLVRDIDGVATYTGPNALREMAELSGSLNGVNVLEDGASGALAAEYWNEAVLDSELMTSRIELRRPEAGPAPFGVPDNPISELTIGAMQDLGYQVDYGQADSFALPQGALSRQVSYSIAEPSAPTSASASRQLLLDIPQSDDIPNGAAYIYTRPNVLSETPRSFALTDANSELVIATGTNAYFIEGVTGETLTVELKGTFEKNNPTSITELSGTVDSMEVYSLTGLALFSVDYSQKPVSVAEVASQWPNYSMDGENVIVVDTLEGASVRINPNGGAAEANRIFAGASDDYVRGGSRAELINGGADNDSLVGEGGNDTLIGESGNDVLTGGRGNDVVNGGGGTDMALYSGSQSSYTLTLGAGSTSLQDRRGDGNGLDTLVSVEFLDFDTDFGDGPFNLQIFGGPTGLSAPDFESFIELYIAYFNRAPDAVGLNFWGTAFANGVSLEEMASLFVGQPETQATYPAGTSTNDFVTSVYTNVLGRTPDGEGFDFWVDALNSGGVTRDIFILDALRGAKSELKPELGQAFVDQQLIDRAYLEDKTDIGAYFAVHKGMSDVANAAAVMALFDGSQGSINAAVAATDGHHADALNPNTGEFLMPLIGVLDDPFAVA